MVARPYSGGVTCFTFFQGSLYGTLLVITHNYIDHINSQRVLSWKAIPYISARAIAIGENGDDRVSLMMKTEQKMNQFHLTTFSVCILVIELSLKYIDQVYWAGVQTLPYNYTNKIWTCLLAMGLSTLIWLVCYDSLVRHLFLANFTCCVPSYFASWSWSHSVNKENK